MNMLRLIIGSLTLNGSIVASWGVLCSNLILKMTTFRFKMPISMELVQQNVEAPFSYHILQYSKWTCACVCALLASITEYSCKLLIRILLEISNWSCSVLQYQRPNVVEHRFAPTVPLFGFKTILEVCWRHGQATVPQRSAIVVGDLLSCKLTVSVGHRGLCAVAAHWPVVTALAETEALCGHS